MSLASRSATTSFFARVLSFWLSACGLRSWFATSGLSGFASTNTPCLSTTPFFFFLRSFGDCFHDFHVTVLSSSLGISNALNPRHTNRIGSRSLLYASPSRCVCSFCGINHARSSHRCATCTTSWRNRRRHSINIRERWKT